MSNNFEQNYKRYDLNYQSTANLQARLSHCIGKSTVEVYRCNYYGESAYAVYHYNALILVYVPYWDMFYINYRFYDYSASTSRVRNEAIRYFGDIERVPTTKQLQAIEKKDCCIKGDYGTQYTVKEITNNRFE